MTAVVFGDTVVPSTDWVRNSNSRITVKAPAHVAGTVDVKVVASGAASANTAADNYTYG